MASIAEQITTLKNKINNVYTLVDGVRQAGALYPTLGNLVTFGCAVAISDSTTVTFQDDDHVNPDKESPVVGGRTETYPNIALVYGEVFTSDNTTASIDGDNLPSATYSRYDLLYVYVNSSGSNIAIATGTPTTGTPTDPTVPAGSMTIARLTVDSTGITAATDLRNFDSRIDYFNATLTGTPTAPTAANGTNTTQIATTEFVQNATVGVNFGKNLLINGDFSVWQRGTSFTGEVGQDLFYADRWLTTIDSAVGTGVANVAKVIDEGIPAIKIDLTTAPNTYNPSIAQRIEDYKVLSGRTVTLSFDVKASTNVIINTGFYEVSGGWIDGAEPDLGTATNTWQTMTRTITFPDLSSLTGDYLLIMIRAELTSIDAVYFRNVQLELGDRFTGFEIVDPATQLARCQRYYEITEYVSGEFLSGYAANNSHFINYVYRVEKAKTPSIHIVDRIGNIDKITTWSGGASTNNVTPTAPEQRKTKYGGRVYHTGSVNTIEFYVIADAEI